MNGAATNRNFLFFGPQGVGKGTQAAVVAEQLRLAHVSTGDLFRRHIAEQTELGRRVKAILDAGALVPDDVTIAMLDDHLTRLRQTQPALRGVIFDGFPRTVAQANALDALLGTRGEHVDALVYLDAPRPVLLERMMSRGRPDDTRGAIERRLRLYEEDTQPLLALYEQRGIVHRVNGDQAVEGVTADIVRVLTPLFTRSAT